MKAELARNIARLNGVSGSLACAMKCLEVARRGAELLGEDGAVLCKAYDMLYGVATRNDEQVDALLRNNR